ncbi:MAG: TVP38/TMEM64 family protein [Verrucomicrobiota bacterium]
MNEKKESKKPVVKLIVLAVVVLGLLAAAKFLPVEQWLKSFNDWVSQMGVAGIFIFIAVYAAATVLLAPGLILTIGAGFAFGLWKGFLAVSAGATLGAALAFLVARFVARDRIEAMAKGNEKFRKIDKAIGKQGAKLIFLLRLSPVIPFNLSNYLYGLTSVKFWPYVLASWIGMMPGTLLYVYLGTVGKVGLEASKGGRARSPVEYVFLGIGLIATVAVTVIVTRVAKRALKEKTE